ncbi:MAG: hypothetical protein J6Q02_04360, partial [Lachnospiraceae bacterium]|nr:hypothetical protein [Lachnospiraceae bacterium]
NISSGASQQIENLIQKAFAKEILNINGLENSNKVSFDELKNYQATSVLQSSRNGKQTNNGVTNSTSNNNYIYSLERVNGKVVMKKTFTNEEIKQLSFPNESNRDTSDKNFVPTSTTQSKFSQPIALLPPPNICKIEDSFAKVKINIRTRRQNESLIFDEKIALKTRLGRSVRRCARPLHERVFKMAQHGTAKVAVPGRINYMGFEVTAGRSDPSVS